MMTIQNQITVRDINHTKIPEDLVQKRTQKLQHLFQPINNCRVVVSLPEKRHHSGALYNVNINLSVPGKKLVVNRQTSDNINIAIQIGRAHV